MSDERPVEARKSKGSGKTDWELKLLALAVVGLYIVSSLVGAYFLFQAESLDSTLSILLMVGFVAITLFTVLACLSFFVAHKKTVELRHKLSENAGQAQDVQEHVQALRSLLKIATLISQNKEISRILDNIVAVVKKHFDADQVSLMLRDQTNGHLDTKATSGEYGAELTHVNQASVKINDSVAGWVAEKGESLLLGDKTDFSGFKGYFKKLAPISSSMCVPLHLGTRVVGVVNVNRLNRKENYNDADLTLLTVFANDIALAIDNARLIRELKRAKMTLEIELQDKNQSPVLKERVVIPGVKDSGQDKKVQQKSSGFQITTKKLPGNIVSRGIYIKGQLDIFNSQKLSQILNSLFAQKIYKFIVDLSQVSYISSAGAGVFMSLIDTLQQNNGNIVFVQPQATVKRSLHLLGLLQIFSAVNTIDAALKLLEEDQAISY